jgi:hypothetical protein
MCWASTQLLAVLAARALGAQQERLNPREYWQQVDDAPPGIASLKHLFVIGIFSTCCHFTEEVVELLFIAKIVCWNFRT